MKTAPGELHSRLEKRCTEPGRALWDKAKSFPARIGHRGAPRHMVPARQLVVWFLFLWVNKVSCHPHWPPACAFPVPSICEVNFALPGANGSRLIEEGAHTILGLGVIEVC